MGKYTNIPCSQCDHPFTEQDDVVVCPDCGAPHHRSCFRELGHCALTDQHAPDFSWQYQSPNAGQGSDGSTVTCSRCGAASPAELPNCQMCGAPMIGTPYDQAAASNAQGQYHRHENSSSTGYFDDWELGGVSARELSAYTGSSSYYFLNQFKRLIHTWGNISWNWGAFFFGFLYFFYRKMYRFGTVLLLFFIVSSAPAMLGFLVGPLDAQMSFYGFAISYNTQLLTQFEFLNTILSAMQWSIMMICGLFANKIYLQTALRKIRSNQTDRKNDPQYYADLYLLGKPNPLLVVLLFVGLFLLSGVLGSFMQVAPIA